MDEKARYTVYRSNNGRCHHCGVRLQWDAFEVPGLSGGWVLEEAVIGPDGEAKDKAFCYRCHGLDDRNRSARLIVKE